MEEMEEEPAGSPATAGRDCAGENRPEPPEEGETAAGTEPEKRT